MDIFEELSLVEGKLKNKFGECEVQEDCQSCCYGTVPTVPTLYIWKDLRFNGDQFETVPSFKRKSATVQM